MGRSPSCARSTVLLLLAATCFGCGGGDTTVVQPPPAPDFLLAFSPNSVSVAQGASSPAVNVTVTPENGFTGSVQITLTGMPSGVTTNPASPFTIAAGAQVSVIFGIATSATTASPATASA